MNCTGLSLLFCAALACCLLGSGDAEEIEWCGVNIPQTAILEAVQKLVPMSDGSVLETGDPAAARLIDVIAGNLRAMGLAMDCYNDVCDISSPGTNDGSCARAFVAAVLGNFLNNDLAPGDALAHIRVDVATGLLRREYADVHYRALFVDFLLVLAVIMLTKRAVDEQRRTT